MDLPKSYIDDLNRGIEEANEISERFGLDPFPIHYEILPSEMIYEIAGYSMPGRFQHWSFGKAFARQKIMYDFGLSKIYELIINTNPCQAFLLDTNTVLQNKLIAAHCIGHSDFFKNNAYFAKTNRHMTNTMETHARQIREYEYEYGQERIESLLDAVLSIGFHIDDGLTAEDIAPKRKKKKRKVWGEYDDLWSRDEQDGEEDEESPYNHMTAGYKPEHPIGDIILYIAQYSTKLEDWERDMLMMLRDEHVYFMPQMKTKICNEGWAVYWHTRIMREMDLTQEEFVEFARMHSGIARPHTPNLNPYHLGFVIFEDIENRFGQDHVFFAREVESDVSLIRNYLTEDLVHDNDLLMYGQYGTDLIVTDRGWELVRDELAKQLSSFHPRIFVADGDYRGNFELLLVHAWDGLPLDVNFAKKTMEYVYRLWGRPVYLQTRRSDKTPILFSYGSHGAREEIGIKVWNEEVWDQL